MRAVVQRAASASVRAGGREIARIGPGLVVLVGVSVRDTTTEGAWLAEKVRGLRIFSDGAGAMNRSVADVGGAVLAVSQFTLYGDARRGRRPGFIDAAPGGRAEPIFDAFVEVLRAAGVPVSTGSFGAMMEVELVNDGPVTILLDSERAF